MKEIIGTQKKAARRPALRAASAAVAAIFCGLAASAAQAQAQLEVPDLYCQKSIRFKVFFPSKGLIFEPPNILIHITRRASELSATSKIVCI